MRHVNSMIALVVASARPSGLHVILMGVFILAVLVVISSSFKNKQITRPLVPVQVCS